MKASDSSASGAGSGVLPRRWFRILIILLPAALLTASDQVRSPKTFVFPTTQSPSVSISNLAGHVTVRGWEKQNVRALCTVSSPRVAVDAEPMPASGAAERVQFLTHALEPLVPESEQAADYDLSVPIGTNLEIRNRQGSVQINHLSGDAWVESVGGTILVADVGGHLFVRSIGGDIEMDRPAGRVEASSITGNLKFVDPTSTKIRGTTTSGRIIYEGDFAPGGSYTLSEYNGDMEILCPAAASFELHAVTVKGHLDNGLDVIRNQHDFAPPGVASSLRATRNAGAARVELTSFSGTIRLRAQR